MPFRNGNDPSSGKTHTPLDAAQRGKKQSMGHNHMDSLGALAQGVNKGPSPFLRENVVGKPLQTAAGLSSAPMLARHHSSYSSRSSPSVRPARCRSQLDSLSSLSAAGAAAPSAYPETKRRVGGATAVGKRLGAGGLMKPMGLRTATGNIGHGCSGKTKTTRHPKQR